MKRKWFTLDDIGFIGFLIVCLSVLDGWRYWTVTSAAILMRGWTRFLHLRERLTLVPGITLREELDEKGQVGYD